MKTNPLRLVFAIAFIDVIAANGLGPLVSQYIVHLPAKPVMLTAGTAVMLGIQLACSPVSGYWSDRQGRRPVAIATTIGSLFSTALLLGVGPAWYLTNRSLKGATNGLYSVMRSAVADLTQKDQLLRYAGLMSFVAGSGTVLGPMSVGWLLLVFDETRFSPVPMVMLLLGLGALNVALAFRLTETNPKQEPVERRELVRKGLNALKVISLWKQLAQADQELPGFKPLFVLNILATLGTGYYAFFIAFLTESRLMMTPQETVYFFTFYGLLALGTNLLFFTYGIQRVNKRKAILLLASLSIGLQTLFAFAESSRLLLYLVAGVDAVTVSLLTGITGSLLSVMVKEGGSEGEMFGNIQGLGGVASFATALVNSLLAGVSLKAPFFFGALSMVAVVVWALRLPQTARQYADQRSAHDMVPER